MRTWNEYKDHVKAIDSEGKKDLEEVKNLAAIIGAIIEPLGLKLTVSEIL